MSQIDQERIVWVSKNKLWRITETLRPKPSCSDLSVYRRGRFILRYGITSDKVALRITGSTTVPIPWFPGSGLPQEVEKAVEKAKIPFLARAKILDCV